MGAEKFLAPNLARNPKLKIKIKSTIDIWWFGLIMGSGLDWKHFITSLCLLFKNHFCWIPPDNRFFFSLSCSRNIKHNWIVIMVYLSRRASCFRSTNNGKESRNSFIFSSRDFPTGKFLVSLGSFRSSFRKFSIPSWRIWTLRLAHNVSDHSSRAAWEKNWECNYKYPWDSVYD